MSPYGLAHLHAPHPPSTGELDITALQALLGEEVTTATPLKEGMAAALKGML